MMHFAKTFRSAPTLAAILALALSACSSEHITAPDTAPRYSVTISGAVEATLTGAAAVVPYPASVVDGTPIPAASYLGFLNDSGTPILIFEWSGVSVPTAGTYTVGLDSTEVAVSYDGGLDGNIYEGTGGTVTVTSADAGRVAGTFSLDAVAHSTGSHVTMTGSFSAAVVPAAP